MTKGSSQQASQVVRRRRGVQPYQAVCQPRSLPADNDPNIQDLGPVVKAEGLPVAPEMGLTTAARSGWAIHGPLWRCRSGAMAMAGIHSDLGYKKRLAKIERLAYYSGFA